MYQMIMKIRLNSMSFQPQSHGWISLFNSSNISILKPLRVPAFGTFAHGPSMMQRNQQQNLYISRIVCTNKHRTGVQCNSGHHRSPFSPSSEGQHTYTQIHHLATEGGCPCAALLPAKESPVALHFVARSLARPIMPTDGGAATGL